MQERQYLFIFEIVVFCFFAASCAWSGGGKSEPNKVDAGRDANNKNVGGNSEHKGFSQKDEYGAYRISYLGDPHRGFDFNGKHVVYCSEKGDMYLVDVESEREVLIAPTTPGDPNSKQGSRSFPVIWDEYIISRAWDGNKITICSYNIKTGEETTVPCSSCVSPRYLDFDSGKLVWNDMRNWNEDGGENLEVYMYNFKDGLERRVTREPLQQGLPKVSGDHIVWEDLSKGKYKAEVVIYSISSEEKIEITNDDFRQSSPNIDGDYVTWMDLRNGEQYPTGGYRNADVYLYRISTGASKQVTAEEHDQEYPVVHKNWIAWTDIRFGTRSQSGIPDTTNIFVYNIDNGEERQVTYGRGFHESNPKIWDDKLVYYSFKTGGWGALWMIELGKYWQ